METKDARLRDVSWLAEKLGISRQAAYRYVRNGEFDRFTVVIGRQYRFRPDAFEEFLRKGGSKVKAE